MPVKAVKKTKKKHIRNAEIEFLTSVAETSDFGLYVQFITSPWKTFAFNFLRGTAYGLGVLIGASIIIALLSYTLQRIYQVPGIGDFAKKGVQSIEHIQPLETN